MKKSFSIFNFQFSIVAGILLGVLIGTPATSNAYYDRDDYPLVYYGGRYDREDYDNYRYAERAPYYDGRYQRDNRNYGLGTHPWDTYRRKHGNHRTSWHSRNYYNYDRYYEPTETHALHPYYRKNYDGLLAGSETGRISPEQWDYLYSFPWYEFSIETDCSEHGYYRRGKRLPPVGHVCYRE